LDEIILKGLIAETDINGGHEDSERWHKALLFKMTVLNSSMN
jgi:hypothetical protein